MKIAFLLCASAFAQTRPQMGVMLDRAGSARAVYGVAASVTLGDAIVSNVISSACSDSWCVWKTADALILNGLRVAAPAGGALLAVDGSSALVYFSDTGAFARWSGGNLTPVEYRIAGEILAVESVNGVARFAVRRRGGTWIVDARDRALSSIPANGAVMLLADGVVYVDGGDVVLRRSDESELRFAAPGAESFSALASNYLQIRAGARSFALRVDAGHEQIFELPEPEE